MGTSEIANRYFNAIRDAWAPFEHQARIIPFCTPVCESPTAIVIGTNHSDFVRGGGLEADRIATEFSKHVPAESTFLIHHHQFARGLNEICQRAKIEIDKKWIGTNRCAVQTGPKGVDGLKSRGEFASCQRAMDRILERLVDELAPRNVILVGKFAASLFYEGAERKTYTDLVPRTIRTNRGESETAVIAIHHFSRASVWDAAAKRLATHFIHSVQ